MRERAARERGRSFIGREWMAEVEGWGNVD
jgi:hypothetical protein